MLSFSDQADIVAARIREGVAVHAFNQRSVAEISAMIRMLGAMVGAPAAAARLARALAAGFDAVRRNTALLFTPAESVFRGMGDPMICGIAWVSELIQVAGGDDIFADRAAAKAAKERIVTAEEVIARGHKVIVGSWCGKNSGLRRWLPGFAQIPAVRNGALREIKSPLILQPGPAAVTDGLRELRALQQAIHSWVNPSPLGRASRSAENGHRPRHSLS